MCPRYGLTGAELSRKITSLPLPATVWLFQLRMLLAVIAASILGWLMFLLLSAKTPCAFSAQQLSSQLEPSWCSCLGLFHPRFRTWHLSLLNLMLNFILVGQVSTACWGLYMVTFSSSTATSSPSLGSSSNLVTVHSSLPSRALIKLNCIDSRRNEFVPSCHCDFEPFNFWASELNSLVSSSALLCFVRPDLNSKVAFVDGALDHGEIILSADLGELKCSSM